MIAVLHVDYFPDAKMACDIAYNNPHHQNEDFSYCVLRERGIELKQLRAAGLPYALVYGKNAHTLQIVSHNIPEPFTIRELLAARWRYRGALNSVFIDQVLRHEPHYQSILRWPSWCPEALLGRSVQLCDFVDFIERSRQQAWDGPLFIKTVHKGEPSRAYRLTGIFQQEDWLRRTKLPQESPKTFSYASKRAQPGDGFIQDAPQPYFNEYQGEMEQRAPSWYAFSGELILSDPLDIAKDEHGTLEYRCFIVAHQVTSISRYLDYVAPEIPDQVREFAEQVVTTCQPLGEHGPGPDYVVDLAITSRGCVVIEFNPLPCSGRYHGNSAAALFDALLPLSTRVDGTDTPPELPVPEVEGGDDDPLIRLQEMLASKDEDQWNDL